MQGRGRGGQRTPRDTPLPEAQTATEITAAITSVIQFEGTGCGLSTRRTYNSTVKRWEVSVYVCECVVCALVRKCMCMCTLAESLTYHAMVCPLGISCVCAMA